MRIKKVIAFDPRSNKPIYDKVLTRVPCGKCLYCSNRKASDWLCRVHHELKSDSFSCSFVTLTYADQMLPTNKGHPTFSKDDVQKFFKRLRSYLYSHEYRFSKNIKIKYVLVAEYGEELSRPHYHALIFNLPYPKDFFKQNEIISNCWQKGYTSCYSYNPRVLHYTVHYLYKTKGLFNSFPEEDKPFLLSSRNPAIGASYISDVNSFVTTHDLCYYYGKKKMPLPDYYLKKIKEYYPNIINTTFKLKEEYERSINEKEYLSRYYNKRALSVKNNLQFLEKQKVKNPELEQFFINQLTDPYDPYFDKEDPEYINKLIKQINHGFS